jgi:hypothetical protein
MTALLWSFEELARLCGHQDQRVKGWAAGRMKLLYPKEAGPLMAGLLNDRNGSVASPSVSSATFNGDRLKPEGLPHCKPGQPACSGSGTNACGTDTCVPPK